MFLKTRMFYLTWKTKQLKHFVKLFKRKVDNMNHLELAQFWSLWEKSLRKHESWHSKQACCMCVQVFRARSDTLPTNLPFDKNSKSTSSLLTNTIHPSQQSGVSRGLYYRPTRRRIKREARERTTAKHDLHDSTISQIRYKVNPNYGCIIGSYAASYKKSGKWFDSL